MLLMAIAGGLAYNYENYVARNTAKSGNLRFVITDTLRSFKNDFRLIKPKKFGFDARAEIEEIELQEVLNKKERESTRCDVKVKKNIPQSIVNDYL